jgi:RimJ/RimL family protein N-acetyltransferase|tara:strand:+ start:916 stop:1038 length:123 start_codon:yes stop_codon:yes gene_type:complete
MALHRITATHIIRSPVSGKVMEKIGMKKEEVLREHVIKWD